MASGKRAGGDSDGAFTLPVDKNRLLAGFNILAGLVFILIVVIYVKFEPALAFDESINRSMVSLETAELTIFFTLITFIGNRAPIIVLSVVLFIVLLVLRKWKHAVMFPIGMLSGWGGYLLAKSALVRARPENPLIEVSEFALPSGHATMAVLFFGFLIFAFSGMIQKKNLKRLFILGCLEMISLIGFSRLYLRVHWPTDVAAGYAFGAFILTSLILLSGALPFKNNA